VSLRTKLELHLADKNASWTGDVARYQADGHASLLSLASPLTAASIVDAIVLALEVAGASKVTVAFEGEASVVAQRTAARLGVTLLDASALPDRAVQVSSIPAPPIDIPPEIGAELLAIALPAHEPELLLEAHVEPVAAVAAVAPPEPLCVPPLPWSGPAPEPAIVAAHVEPLELLALPWHAELGEPAEVTLMERRPAGALRPTQMPDWGLPWPRPIAATDGLAIADPKLWGNQERMRAVREDLVAKGAPSFGQIKPEGSAWLKRLQNGP
jgi:hypothetical protein